MTQVMKGIRVLEVAQFTFVPAAGAVLADWGADVIKIEHPVRGDTQRGFINMGGIPVDPNRNPLIEHPNRGKRSVMLDLRSEEGKAQVRNRPRVTRLLPTVEHRLRPVLVVADAQKHPVILDQAAETIGVHSGHVGNIIAVLLQPSQGRVLDTENVILRPGCEAAASRAMASSDTVSAEYRA